MGVPSPGKKDNEKGKVKKSHEVVISAHAREKIVLKQDASQKEGTLSCFKYLFEYIAANLAHTQAENVQNIRFWQKAAESMPLSTCPNFWKDESFYFGYLFKKSSKTRAGKIELSCRLGTTRRVLQKNFLKACHIINPLLTKFVQSRWLDIGLVSFFASLWTSTPSRSINTHKENLANIQPSWPHT